MRFSNFFFALIILLPTIVSGLEEEEDGNKNLAVDYKSVAIVMILFANFIGFCIAAEMKMLEAPKKFFCMLKALVTGLTMSTACAHVLPDAFESMTSPFMGNSSHENAQFVGFIAMVAAIGSLVMDADAAIYCKRQTTVKDGSEEETPKLLAEELRHRVMSKVLVFRIIVHSVIIGIALGTSQNLQTITFLGALLTFHQFIEGVGLGGFVTEVSMIRQVKFNVLAVLVMATIFTLSSIPLSTAFGIRISKTYGEMSVMVLIVRGVSSSASAGILIYMALVNFTAVDFMGSKIFQFVLGVGCIIPWVGCIIPWSRW